jgi:hypothetical protein
MIDKHALWARYTVCVLRVTAANSEKPAIPDIVTSITLRTQRESDRV